MSTLFQMLQLSGQTSSKLQLISILEEQIQQKIAPKEIYQDS